MVFQKVVSLQYRHSASSVQEHSFIFLDLIFDAQIVVIIDDQLYLPHAVVISHFEVELRVAIHDTAFLDHVLEWSSLLPEG